MEKRGTRFSWLVTAGLVLILLVAGCSGGGGGNNGGNAAETPTGNEGNTGTNQAETAEPQLYELGKEPLEFTFYGNYDWYTMPKWGADETTAWVKDNKQVNITEIPNGGNTVQKLNTMIASGDLPDVIWGNAALTLNGCAKRACWCHWTITSRSIPI
ncbi:hypothetical protein HMSSN139_47990 [Paenibacillus sp. HMSSN-139]|nr:hypothetical protein HMSSN139_47990 [Paenibacillus sp. HMSSN-139]